MVTRLATQQSLFRRFAPYGFTFLYRHSDWFRHKKGLANKSQALCLFIYRKPSCYVRCQILSAAFITRRFWSRKPIFAVFVHKLIVVFSLTTSKPIRFNSVMFCGDISSPSEKNLFYNFKGFFAVSDYCVFFQQGWKQFMTSSFFCSARAKSFL